MIDILSHVQGYVPCKATVEDVVVGDKRLKHQEFNYVTSLVGGDQLSVARARGSQEICLNGNNRKEKLRGLLPVAEDWHAKMCFMEVGWYNYYQLMIQCHVFN